MSRRNQRNRSKRDNSSIANDPLTSLLRPLPVPREETFRFPTLLDVEDHRRFTPDTTRKYFSNRITNGAVSRHVLNVPAKQAPVKSGLPAHIYHEVPQDVAVCVRRKARKEVLHALKRLRAGKGASKRRNPRSDVRC